MTKIATFIVWIGFTNAVPSNSAHNFIPILNNISPSFERFHSFHFRPFGAVTIAFYFKKVTITSVIAINEHFLSTTGLRTIVSETIQRLSN